MSASVKNDCKKLRLITYLTPSTIPLGLLDVLRDYLEAELRMEVSIIYESRWSGPPPGRADPFTTNDVDIAFMCSTAFLRLLQDKNKFVELCHAAPVHSHPKAGGSAVYFSEVMVDNKELKKYKDFHSLKGCRWAYSDELSLSGNIIVLAELKKLGFNASFFGDIIKSGSHLKSIQMILNHQVDAAAIDSTTLMNFSRDYPERVGNLAKLTSFGPMPVQPIVFRKHLPDEMKQRITKLLLEMHSKPDWGCKLHTFGITKYVTVDESLYDLETEIKDLVRGQTINPAYY